MDLLLPFERLAYRVNAPFIFRGYVAVTTATEGLNGQGSQNVHCDVSSSSSPIRKRLEVES